MANMNFVQSEIFIDKFLEILATTTYKSNQYIEIMMAEFVSFNSSRISGENVDEIGSWQNRAIGEQ